MSLSWNCRIFWYLQCPKRDMGEINAWSCTVFPFWSMYVRRLVASMSPCSKYSFLISLTNVQAMATAKHCFNIFIFEDVDHVFHVAEQTRQYTDLKEKHCQIFFFSSSCSFQGSADVSVEARFFFWSVSSFYCSLIANHLKKKSIKEWNLVYLTITMV